MKVTALNEKEFNRKIVDVESAGDQWNFLGEKPALVEFFASWCGHCKAFAPILDEVAGEYGDKIDFYKVDVQQERDLASTFGVEGIPTLLFIPLDGSPQIIAGSLPKEDLEEALESVLLEKA